MSWSGSMWGGQAGDGDGEDNDDDDVEQDVDDANASADAENPFTGTGPLTNIITIMPRRMHKICFEAKPKKQEKAPVLFASIFGSVP